MPITVKDLKDCTIVNYTISRHGGQRYARENESTYVDPYTGEETQTWDTRKTTKDPEEFKKASSLQTKAKYALSKLGAHSPMGVIVRRDRREEAERVATEWEQKIQEFNATARWTDIEAWITIWDLEGRNVNQLEKVLDRMFNVLAELQGALDTFDPDNIRNVLQKMNGYSEILPEAAAEAFDRAVQNAKQKAKDLSKYDKRAKKLSDRIDAEVEGLDPEQVLAERERLVKQMQEKRDEFSREQLPEMKKRTFALRKAIAGRKDALEKLEETRQSISRNAVERARFAVMKRRPGMTDEDAQNAARLQGAQNATRFARLGQRPGVEKLAANDS